MKNIIAVLALTLIAPVAGAEVLETYSTQDASYASVRQNNADGYVNVSFYEEGAGPTSKKYLSLYVQTRDENGFWQLTRWNGVVPAEAISINGVNNATINVDTCQVETTYNYANGCGVVSLTVTKDPQAFGSTSAGAYAYNWNGLIMQFAGSWTTHNSTATGSVYGINIDTAANNSFGSATARIGKYTNVSVTVTTGN